ncbi:MAG: hypothetical protein IPP29_16850 [Bacteroidetes bacterium]|nr:hypothetical protein [Bacteroidota bacterium]
MRLVLEREFQLGINQHHHESGRGLLQGNFRATGRFDNSMMSQQHNAQLVLILKIKFNKLSTIQATQYLNDTARTAK